MNTVTEIKVKVQGLSHKILKICNFHYVLRVNFETMKVCKTAMNAMTPLLPYEAKTCDK